MAYNRKQAKDICNQTEYQLFESSMKGSIEKLPQARVQSGIKRSRTLRDKYRDLHKRQRIATRERTGTKKGVKPDTNARTEQKAKLFAEVLTRFEARLKAIKAEAVAAERAAKKAGKKKAAKKKVSKKAATGKPAAKKASKKKAAKKKAAKKKVAKKVTKKVSGKKAPAKKAASKASQFVSEQAAAASKRQRAQNTRSNAIMGHTSSATKRNQAKRDGGKKK